MSMIDQARKNEFYERARNLNFITPEQYALANLQNRYEIKNAGHWSLKTTIRPTIRKPGTVRPTHTVKHTRATNRNRFRTTPGPNTATAESALMIYGVTRVTTAMAKITNESTTLGKPY